MFADPLWKNSDFLFPCMPVLLTEKIAYIIINVFSIGRFFCYHTGTSTENPGSRGLEYGCISASRKRKLATEGIPNQSEKYIYMAYVKFLVLLCAIENEVPWLHRVELKNHCFQNIRH